MFDSSLCLLHQGTFWASPQVRWELIRIDVGCQDHQSQEPEREGAVIIETEYKFSNGSGMSVCWLLADYVLKIDMAQKSTGRGHVALCQPHCVFLALVIQKWWGQMSEHSSVVTLSSKIFDKLQTKSPPNTKPNPWLTHVAVIDDKTVCEILSVCLSGICMFSSPFSSTCMQIIQLSQHAVQTQIH